MGKSKPVTMKQKAMKKTDKAAGTKKAVKPTTVKDKTKKLQDKGKKAPVKRMKSSASLNKDDFDTNTMSLEDKLHMLRKSTKEVGGDGAVALAKKQLTPLDRSKMWSKVQTEMKTNAQLKEQYDAAQGKDAKGKVITAWHLDPEGGPIFKNITKNIQAEQTLRKKEKWESMKSMSMRFDQEEIELHIKSGRISERESLTTPGVWEYKDNGDLEVERVVKKGKVLARQQNCEADSEDDFSSLFDGTMMGLTNQSISGLGLEAWTEGTGTKGKGKGDDIEITILKGKGKGKHKGKDPIPATAPEDACAEAMAKTKQATSLCYCCFCFVLLVRCSV